MERIINDLIETCAIIKDFYINLAYMEAINNDIDYRLYLGPVKEFLNREKRLLIELANKNLIEKAIGYIKKRKKYIDSDVYDRISNTLYNTIGEDAIEYADILRFDIAKINLSLINELLNNENNEQVKEKLLSYKYYLYYTNVDLEYNFLNGLEPDIIELECANYRNDYFLGSKYVDIAILAYESRLSIEYLTKCPSDFKRDSDTYSKMIIEMFNVLSKITICDEETLNLIYPDFEYLLYSENVSGEIREFALDMLNLLASIKNRIYESR